MQEITFEEKLKINAEVARHIKDTHNKAGRNLCAFIRLKYCDKNLQKYYYDAFLKYINETDISRIIAEISMKDYSYVFWIDSVLEDIQYYRKPSRESDCNDRQAYDDIVKYAFYAYIDMLAEVSISAAKELLTAVLNDFRCDFIKDIAIIKLGELQYLLDEEQKKNDKEKDKEGVQNDEEMEKRYKDVLQSEFSPGIIFMTQKINEKREERKAAQKTNKKKSSKFDGFLPNVKYDFDISEEVVEQKIPHEVQKISRENNKIVSSRTFNSKNEADDYVSSIQREFPDLMRIFDFKIVVKKK